MNNVMEQTEKLIEAIQVSSDEIDINDLMKLYLCKLYDSRDLILNRKREYIRANDERT